LVTEKEYEEYKEQQKQKIIKKMEEETGISKIFLII
jgi:hypothetical protein